MRLACVAWIAFAVPSAVGADSVPVQFSHDRVFIHARAPDGSSVRFYTDSGGGYNAVTESTAKRFGLDEIGRVESESGERTLVSFPRFLEDAGVPRPHVEKWLNGGLMVVPDTQLEGHGFLGSRWFEGKVWMFDYESGTLSSSTSWTPTEEYSATAIGFRSGLDSVRDLSFPRLAIEVDGQTLEMLLDTGATAKLSQDSAAAYGLPVATKVGTSFITRPVFEAWVEKHPTWQVVEDGDQVTGTALPMIQVPAVTVAGVTVGPVWFAQRPEGTFERWISQMTDAPVVGAVGGSLFRHFRMVIDYPNARAYFSAVRDVPATPDASF